LIALVTIEEAVAVDLPSSRAEGCVRLVHRFFSLADQGYYRALPRVYLRIVCEIPPTGRFITREHWCALGRC
jgi:hypothetical protein